MRSFTRVCVHSLVAATLLVGASSCRDPIVLDWRTSLRSPAWSAPLVTESFIAVGTETGLVVLNPDGKVRCRFDTGRRVGGQPSTDNLRIYFGSQDYNLYAITPRCGEAWRYQTRDRIKASPLVAAESVIAASMDGHLYALSGDRGKLQWAFPPLEQGQQQLVVGPLAASSPVLSNGVVYVGSTDGRLYAVGLDSGQQLWSFQTDASITSTPFVDRGIVYVGSTNGRLYAIDSEARRALWHVRTRDWIASSPFVAGSAVYVGSNDRKIYAVRRVNGAPLWAKAIDGPATASVTASGELLFAAGAGGDGRVYAFDRLGGSLRWSYQTERGIYGAPVVFGRRLYVSSTDGSLYSFRPRDGASLRWGSE